MEKIKKFNKSWRFKVYFMCFIIAILCFSGMKTQATGKFIVINPGHMAESDPGAVNSVTNIKEVDLNNALAIKTVKTLRDAGYNAVLSHPIPGNPGLPTLLPSIPNYSSYTKTICDTANKKEADLLISIHHNSGENSSGYELYWSSYHPEVDNDGIYQVGGLWSSGEMADLDATPHKIAVDSKTLANGFNQNFKSLGYVPSQNKIVERDDAITRLTSMPSVLIEAGFVSNNEESLKLANGTNQQKMADQILKTINEFMGNAETEEMTAKSVTASVSGTKITAKMTGLKAPAGVKEIKFPTWSSVNGQDDVKWYTGTKQSDGSYQIDIDTKDHNNDVGEYVIHCYGIDNEGKQVLLGNTTANVESILVAATTSGNKITAKVTGISAGSDLKSISFPIWSDVNGQDDIIWYTGIKQSDGSYQVTIDIKDHKGDTGVYNIHCYKRDSKDIQTILGGTTTNVLAKDMTAESLSVSSEGNQINANILGITAPNGVSEVLFPTWSEAGGQDDIIWYVGEKQVDGSYKVTIDIKDHNNETGIYNVHCYGRDQNNQQFMLGETTTNVLAKDMTAESLSVSSEGNQINANILGITAPNGVSEVLFPTWSEAGGQDDIIWYVGEKQVDGSYKVTIDIKDHNNETGIYNVHCYGRDQNNQQFMLGETVTTVGNMTAESLSVSSEGNQINANILGITAPNGVSEVLFPTWSEAGGQDDIIWYVGEKQVDGSYKVTIDIKDHNNETGIYNIHCYGRDQNNQQFMLGETVTTIGNMTAESLSVSSEGNQINANILGITAPNGVSEVLFPTWSEAGGQDDIIWYVGEKQVDGSYKVTIDIKDHNNETGIYNVHCYGRDNAGKIIELGTGEVTVSGEEVTTKTPIMDNTTVTAEELVAYYDSLEAIYPDYYESLGVDLDAFVQMYIEEAEIEGVRAEVAFAQMLLETGSLGFGGDVKLEQFNFAGLGATGGVPGFDFSLKYGKDAHGLQMGIRGHVQHLKCYGSDEPLNQENVDPRWGDWLRLRAVTVEELAGTWAIDPNYATKLLKIMSQF